MEEKKYYINPDSGRLYYSGEEGGVLIDGKWESKSAGWIELHENHFSLTPEEGRRIEHEQKNGFVRKGYAVVNGKAFYTNLEAEIEARKVETTGGSVSEFSLMLHRPEEEYDEVTRAIRLATECHGGQRAGQMNGQSVGPEETPESAYKWQWENGGMFIHHPLEVLQILAEMGAHSGMQIAGLLHEAVGDAKFPVTIEEIREKFGIYVANRIEECRNLTAGEIAEKSDDVKRIVLADILSEQRDILRKKKRVKPLDEETERFIASREEHLREMQQAVSGLQADENARPAYEELVSTFVEIYGK